MIKLVALSMIVFSLPAGAQVISLSPEVGVYIPTRWLASTNGYAGMLIPDITWGLAVSARVPNSPVAADVSYLRTIGANAGIRVAPAFSCAGPGCGAISVPGLVQITMIGGRVGIPLELLSSIQPHIRLGWTRKDFSTSLLQTFCGGDPRCQATHEFMDGHADSGLYGALGAHVGHGRSRLVIEFRDVVTRFEGFGSESTQHDLMIVTGVAISLF